MPALSTTSLLSTSRAPALTRSRMQSQRPRRAHRLVVRAHDDEEILPLLGLPKHDWNEKDLEALAHPHLLGGKTIGEELALIRRDYLASEAKALAGEAHLHSSNWDGDVYIGGRWNTLSVLYLIFLLTPLAGLVFAWASYGSLWGLDYVPPPLY